VASIPSDAASISRARAVRAGTGESASGEGKHPERSGRDGGAERRLGKRPERDGRRRKCDRGAHQSSSSAIKMKQIAAQLATIAAGEPRDARSTERLGDAIRQCNRL
jgi:hypothetical protein